MGTETTPHYDLEKPLLLRLVKLNNPLMGTETDRLKSTVVMILSHVKLNNPLMGTETGYTAVNSLRIVKPVKLNNPLMGTETSLPNPTSTDGLTCELN